MWEKLVPRQLMPAGIRWIPIVSSDQNPAVDECMIEDARASPFFPAAWRAQIILLLPVLLHLTCMYRSHTDTVPLYSITYLGTYMLFTLTAFNQIHNVVPFI